MPALQLARRVVALALMVTIVVIAAPLVPFIWAFGVLIVMTHSTEPLQRRVVFAALWPLYIFGIPQLLVGETMDKQPKAH